MSSGTPTGATPKNKRQHTHAVRMRALAVRAQPPGRKPVAADSAQLSDTLSTRLQYAMFKVQHGWTKQSLSEVENLYYRRIMSTSVPRPPPETHTSTPAGGVDSVSEPAAARPPVHTPPSTAAAGSSSQRRTDSPPAAPDWRQHQVLGSAPHDAATYADFWSRLGTSKPAPPPPARGANSPAELPANGSAPPANGSAPPQQPGPGPGAEHPPGAPDERASSSTQARPPASPEAKPDAAAAPAPSAPQLTDAQAGTERVGQASEAGPAEASGHGKKHPIQDAPEASTPAGTDAEPPWKRMRQDIP